MRALVAALLLSGAACRAPAGATGPGPHAGRHVELFVPPGAARPPLVIVLHHGERSGREVRQLTGFDRVAAREKFVVAYPDGVDRHWNDGRPEIATGADDVAFIAWLIDELAVRHGIDRSRVYVTGMSNGAMMAYRLGCELSGRIAAIAPVAGQMPARLRCRPAAPLSVLAIIGTADPIVPPAGGELSTHHGQVRSAAASIAPFAARAGCGPPAPPVTERDVDPTDGARARRTGYPCPAPFAIELLALEGAGHTWPGGPQYLPPDKVGTVARDFDGAERIWRFFAPRRRATPGRAGRSWR
ncbi:MAG TPA: PHB depolymerase family esterase [Kofleriaceae bacterium]|nr:PHB depolymerase family esterase [Kofleriaceae bacterium]